MTTGKTSSSLSDLPQDELVVYATELGIVADPDTPHGELLRRVRERRELLMEIDRDALLEIVVSARVPVRRSASKEELAKQIALLQRPALAVLSDRGLIALAKLRDIPAGPGDSRNTIERRLRHLDGLWARVGRKRRRLAGTLISKLFEGSAEQRRYEFLPEDPAGPSLKESIENVGVVGGIAQRIRGAADHYVEEKLDQIEARIDAKLDEIDRRLGEWRDRELKNRLKLVKITLVTSIIVAALSLGYDYVKKSSARQRPSDPPAGAMATE